MNIKVHGAKFANQIKSTAAAMQCNESMQCILNVAPRKIATEPAVICKKEKRKINFKILEMEECG